MYESKYWENNKKSEDNFWKKEKETKLKRHTED